MNEKKRIPDPDLKARLLSDKELRQISGGFGHDDGETPMHCENPNCPYPDEHLWAGDYEDCGPFQCPECGQLTLMGTKFRH